MNINIAPENRSAGKLALIISIFLLTSFIIVYGGSAAGTEPAGNPCNISDDCISGYCRSDYIGEKYCAQDSVSCVHKVGSIVQQYNNGQHAPECCDINRERICMSGVWTCLGCGLYKKCQNGQCVNMDSDNDGVIDANDKCLGTPSSCTVANGKIDPATGCPKIPFGFHIKNDISESCPSSSIPVDPYNAGCLSSSDASQHMTLKIGSYIANNNCDPISGTSGWHDIEDGRNYCEFKIGSSVPQGTYNLHAVYNLNGVPYDQTFKTNFKVEKECSTSSPCAHGGRVTTSPSCNLRFDPPCKPVGGGYVCKIGTKVSLKDISSYHAVCSNGAHADTGPVCMIAWLYSGSIFKAKADNKCMGCSSPNVPVPMKYRTDLLKESKGLRWNCDINWYPSGSNKIDNVYAFNAVGDAGSYTLYLDYINAVCDSPDYICPTSGTLCKIGTMSSDYKGFENLASYKIKVINPILEVTSRPEDPKEEFLNKTDKNVILEWQIKNTGVGDAQAVITPKCDSELNCHVLGFENGIIPENGIVTTILNITLPCRQNDFNESVGISVEYKDTYGLYETPKKLEDSVILNVLVPSPSVNFENKGPFSHNAWESNKTLIQWYVLNSGIGRISLLNVTSACPSDFLCSSINFPKEVENEGYANLTVNTSKFNNYNITVNDYSAVDVKKNAINITYTINFTHIYDDAYGLECINSKEKKNSYPFSIIKTCSNETYYFEQIVNINKSNYVISNESVHFENKTYYCVHEGWNTNPFSNGTKDYHCYHVSFGDKNDNDIDCCIENNDIWINNSAVFENGTHPNCCGDDNNEYYLSSNLDKTEACCKTLNDCVYNKTCNKANEWYSLKNKTYYCGPADGKFYEHPLAEFEVESLVVIIGEEKTIKIKLRNVQKEKDNITLNLTGYKKARFASNNKRNLKIELNSGEQKEVSIIISSSEPKKYDLLLSAQSSTNPLLKDSDKISIMFSFPASFSGLNYSSLIVLLLLCLLLYYKLIM